MNGALVLLILLLLTVRVFGLLLLLLLASVGLGGSAEVLAVSWPVGGNRFIRYLVGVTGSFYAGCLVLGGWFDVAIELD